MVCKQRVYKVNLNQKVLCMSHQINVHGVEVHAFVEVVHTTLG